MSRLCRLKTKSHGDDGRWAYDEITRLRQQVATLTYAAGQASKAPDGWKIEKKPDGIIVISKKGFGGYAASPNQQESFIANEILYELASDLLAAAPSQEGGE